MQTTGRLTCSLPHVEFLAVAGRNAGDFLQRQTTQDLAALAPGDTILAAWLDARGRARALFRVLRTWDRWLLAIADQDAGALANDLRMFVLRSDVKLAVEPEWLAIARIGDAEDWLAACANPDRDDARTAGRREEACLAQLAPELFHLYGPAARVRAIAGSIDGDSQAAIRAEIAAGIPSVPPAIAQQFTAHMLNLDTLGAVSFAKGCYPGQEITARTQNLGAVKRRAMPFRAQTDPLPALGSSVVDAAGEPVGTVIRAVRADTRQAVMLAVVQLDRLDMPLYLPLEGRPRLTPLHA